jgi:CcmD family protein
MNNSFLVLAYWFLWIIFMLYAAAIHRRQGRLEKELEELKNAVRGRDASGSGNS